MRHYILLPLFFFSISRALATEDLSEKERPRLQKVEVQRLVASNWQDPMLQQGYWHYRQTIDGKITTSWGTGRPFLSGVEWIQFSFDRYVTLRRISMAIGVQSNQLSTQNFEENGRPKEITLSFSDGTRQAIRLNDMPGMQNIEIRPVRTRWVRMTIQEIYLGNQKKELTKDFGIAEVEFYAEKDPYSALLAAPKDPLLPPAKTH